jgi:excisionase family DNA binding protein
MLLAMAADPHDLPVLLLTVNEAAHQLNCSTETIRQMLRDGSLTPVRLRDVLGAQVRVRTADVQSIVNPEWSRDRRRFESDGG